MKLDELNKLRLGSDNGAGFIPKGYALIEPDKFPIRFRHEKRGCTAVFRYIEGVICDAWAIFDDGDIESLWDAWTEKVWHVIRTTMPGDTGIKLLRWKGWTRVA